MTGTLTITRGLPASGKTTWVFEQIRLHGGVEFSRDGIRAELHPAPWPHGDRQWEAACTLVQAARIRFALASGVDVYVHDTNLHPDHVQFLKDLAPDGVDVRVVDFTHVDVDTCVARDAARVTKPVGEARIREMHHHFLASTDWATNGSTNEWEMPCADDIAASDHLRVARWAYAHGWRMKKVEVGPRRKPLITWMDTTADPYDTIRINRIVLSVWSGSVDFWAGHRNVGCVLGMTDAAQLLNTAAALGVYPDYLSPLWRAGRADARPVKEHTEQVPGTEGA